MAASVFPFAGLLIAHDASPADGSRIADLTRTIAASGASPVVVALAPDADAPASARVVRTRAGGSAITAIRLGMAQLTNTPARSVLLVPLGAACCSLVELLALVDAAKRDEQAIVTRATSRLDESAMLLPRDAWLELVTVGEGGMDAVAKRHRVVRVPAELS